MDTKNSLFAPHSPFRRFSLLLLLYCPSVQVETRTYDMLTAEELAHLSDLEVRYFEEE
jgi:hypothetical protein